MTAAPLRLSASPAADDVTGDATSLFDALAEAESTEYITRGRLPTAGEVATTTLDAAWSRARVVSFDVFDTLLVRKVASPRDVFLQLATPAPFAGWGCESKLLAKLRQQAEDEARHRGVSLRGTSEVTLHEIHEVLAELLQQPASDVPAMVQAERLVERALCVAHPHVHRLFTRAVADGKIVWCVSDTYHEQSFLLELLTGCGFALDGVRVVSSADARMSKGEGKLLVQLTRDAGLQTPDVLHIGDHESADFTIPTRLGFVAVRHPWAASLPTDRPATQPGDAIALGLAQIASRTVEPAVPFWWRFGYSVAGPLLSGFALWLHAQFLSDGIERAYFLLRDGEIILDVYRALLGERVGPETALLESSRRAFTMPALTSGNASITSQLMACENPRPARDFLDRVGIRSADFRSAFKAVGLSPDEIVAEDDTHAMMKMLTLFARKDVLNALLARSQSERQLLTRYLAQEGVLAPGRIALVDIGWNGTIQKGLAAVAELEITPVDMHGYYLGTLPPIVRDLAGSSARGFLFDAGVPLEHAHAVMQLRQLVEFICTTTRGSLRGFRVDSDQVLPVHAPVDHPASQRAHVDSVRAGALAYARSLAQEQTVFGVQPISPAAALRNLARTILDPTGEEAREIGNILHGDGQGSDCVRALAAYSDGPFTPDSLTRDRAQSYWPTGLMARREPAALALRAMTWLRGG